MIETPTALVAPTALLPSHRAVTNTVDAAVGAADQNADRLIARADASACHVQRAVGRADACAALHDHPGIARAVAGAAFTDDADIEQSAGVGQADALARRQHNGSLRRVEQTLVANLLGNQRDVATVAGIDRAVVNDAAVARAGKSKLTAACAEQKIGVGNIQRARHPSADIHLGARAKGDAVRVDQKDLAIRQ